MTPAMTHARRGSWSFAAVAVTVLAAVGAVTALVLAMEAERDKAEMESGRQDSIRLALWRLDGLMAPAIAAEAQRPPNDYAAFSEQKDAYTKLLRQIRPGEILLPSPLMSWRSEVFPLHFQIDASGALSSPQAPSGNALDLVSSTFLTVDLAENRAALDAIADRLDVAKLKRMVADGERRLERSAGARLALLPTASPIVVDVESQVRRTEGEWNVRQEHALNALRNDGLSSYGENRGRTQSERTESDRERLIADPDDAGSPGPLIPFFTGERHDQPGDLLLARSVTIAGAPCFQAVLCDWDRIRELLQGEIEDLLPGANLSPILAGDTGDSTTTGLRLATLPVELSTLPAAPVLGAVVTVERVVLVALWIAILGGLITGAMSLRTTIRYGEKKSRFASAVTHELRTPLTTFQMYTELLADGMVPDAAKRQTLLETLRSESVRLSGLVESVLAYARIEEGRSGARAAAYLTRPLVERLIVGLESRAAAVGMSLRVSHDYPDDCKVVADPDGLGLILGNLVDNSGKYAGRCAGPRGGPPSSDPAGDEIPTIASLTGGPSDPHVIEIDVRRRGRSVHIDVRDFGPGVPDTERDAIFDAFERGEHHSHDPTPGLGVGLSLARSLAREMGGDLTLCAAEPIGARFRITLRAT